MVLIVLTSLRPKEKLGLYRMLSSTGGEATELRADLLEDRRELIAKLFDLRSHLMLARHAIDYWARTKDFSRSRHNE